MSDNNLSPAQLADLRSSGLTDETIREAAITSCHDETQLSAWLNRRYSKRCGPAIVFPFRELTGELNGYRRLKPTLPRVGRDGKKIKYESPTGIPNRAYLPLPVIPHLTEQATELLITEGEKKSLAACQAGFMCIGLVGVFGWKLGKGADRLIPDLEAIKWNGRRVVIAFDSDAATNPNVADGECRLAAQLANRGARVRIARLPDGPDSTKQGIDDFLVRHGRVELRKILDAAAEPEPAGEAAKLPANQLDAMPEARRWLAQHGVVNKLPIIRRWRQSYWAHDGKRFQQLTDDHVRSRVTKWLDTIASHVTRSTVSNLMACIEAETYLASSIEMPSWLNGNAREVVAVGNGLLDIELAILGQSGALQPHSPLWFSSVCLPYPFDPAADCPKWLAVIERNLEGDAERIALAQEWAGYLLTKDTSLQKFLLAVGEGGNGKSVYFAMLVALLGKENISSVPLEVFGQRFQLVPTLGKLANIVAECGELEKIAEGLLKSFVSGDAMQFEEKLKQPFMAKPTARVCLATNNLPRFSDKSQGIWRRVLLLPFNVTITEAEKVRGMDSADWWEESGELPGILNWALAGLRRLREQRRFTESDACRHALEQYKTETNPARAFLLDNYREHPQGELATHEIYSQYTRFCDANGYRKLASHSLSREIQRTFPKSVPGKVRDSLGDRQRGFTGICEGAETVPF